MSIYFPYLRAKTFEVKAVSQIAKKISLNKKITPIFEPVTSGSRALINKSDIFSTANLPLGLIMNPRVGAYANNAAGTLQLLNELRNNGCIVIPSLIVDSNTTNQEISWIQSLSNPAFNFYIYTEQPTSLNIVNLSSLPGKHIINHGSLLPSHESQFPNFSKVKLNDGFKAQKTNASYPPQSIFENFALNYGQLGFSGFSDFAIAGKTFKTSGGPAYAVAIHITELLNNSIICNHFLSTSNHNQDDPARKFGEALNSLMNYSYANPGKIDFTDAFRDLLSLYNTQHFPGLGEVKRIGIQHHIELISSMI